MSFLIRALAFMLIGAVIVVVFIGVGWVQFTGWVLGAPTWTEKLRAWWRRRV